MNEDERARESLKRLLNWAISPYPIIYYPGGLPMQQTTPLTKTYLDELFDISTSAFDTALGAGRTEKEAYRVAMGMVAARVKADIQAELREDRWHTAATVLDLWAAARDVPLDLGSES